MVEGRAALQVGSFKGADGESAMIKVKVDWRQKCPGCGTEVVVDFFDESVVRQACPWCGRQCEMERTTDDELRRYISRSVREIEDRANEKLLV